MTRLTGGERATLLWAGGGPPPPGPYPYPTPHGNSVHHALQSGRIEVVEGRDPTIHTLECCLDEDCTCGRDPNWVKGPPRATGGDGPDKWLMIPRWFRITQHGRDVLAEDDAKPGRTRYLGR